MFDINDNISKAVEILKQGGIVAFPTDTVYGIGCNIFNTTAAEKIFSIKQREATKPLAAHVGSSEQILNIANVSHPLFSLLSEKFLPGPLAIILPKKDIIDDKITSGLKSISIRFPNCREAIELALQLGKPIAATSANLSGLPSAIHHSEVTKYFGKTVDFIVEGGFTKFRKESTIIDLTNEDPLIRRVGYLTPETIEQAIGMKIKVL